MKKIYNNGFTLLELLAVLVILGVFTLISIPLVASTIESSKQKGAKISATNYITEFEKQLSLDNELDTDISSGTYKVQSNGSVIGNSIITNLQVKGNLPTNGIICVDDDNNVLAYSLQVNEYVINYSGTEEEAVKGTKVLDLACDIKNEVITIVPNTSICSKNKIVTINYPEIDGIKKEYRINSGEWLEYTEPLIITTPLIIFAKISNGISESDEATLTISKIDNEDVSDTSPTLSLSSTSTTSSIVSTLRQTDDCGLDENSIEYGISNDNITYTWQKNNKFTRLKNNTRYYIKTRANDIALSGLKESKVSSIVTGDITIPSYNINTTEWATSKIVTVSYSGKNLNYYFKSSVNVTSDIAVSSCGTGNTPENCSGSVTNIVANTWYKAGLKVKLTYTSPGTLVARTDDGVNYKDASTFSVTKIDTTPPFIGQEAALFSRDSNTVTVRFTTSDSESGIKSTECVYGTSPSYGNVGKIVGDTCVMENLGIMATYYYKITATNNAGLESAASASGVRRYFLPTGLKKGTPVYMVPETKMICSVAEAVSTTGTKTGCMKWYIYKETSTSVYQLILDHNTTPLVSWNSSGSNTSMKEVSISLASDTLTWHQTLSPRLITASEIAEITDNKNFDGKTPYYFDTNTSLRDTTLSSSNKSAYAWLYDYTNMCTGGIVEGGCNVVDNSTYGYWTSNPFNDTYSAWFISRMGSLDRENVNVGDLIGIRPVVTFY